MKNNFRKIVIFVLVLCSFIFTNCFKKTDEVSDKTEILTEENEQTTNFLQEIPQIKKTEKQITWKRDRNVDQDDIIHKVWIKSAVDEEGSVVFNENDLFLTVDDGSGDEMVWHLSKVIDGLLGEEKGEYKIISEIAYKIDVGDGSFGVLVLSQYKDNKVYPVILRYVDTLDNKGEINFFTNSFFALCSITTSLVFKRVLNINSAISFANLGKISCSISAYLISL